MKIQKNRGCQVRPGMGARGVGVGRGGWLVAMLGVGVMWGMGDVNQE